jgi:hypothetical protein
MENQANTEIVKKLLKNREAMEKSFDFAPSSIKRAQKMDPAKKFREVHLFQLINELEDSQSDKRQSAAAELVKSLNVKTAPKKCSQCGAPIETGARFCENCGAQLAGS